MEGCDILPARRPEGFTVAALLQKAHPDEDVAGIGAQAVHRPHAERRAGAKEAVEVMIIAAVVPEDERHPVNQTKKRCASLFLSGESQREAVAFCGSGKRGEIGETKLWQGTSSRQRNFCGDGLEPVPAKIPPRRNRDFGGNDQVKCVVHE